MPLAWPEGPSGCPRLAAGLPSSGMSSSQAEVSLPRQGGRCPVAQEPGCSESTGSSLAALGTPISIPASGIGAFELHRTPLEVVLSPPEPPGRSQPSQRLEGSSSRPRPGPPPLAGPVLRVSSRAGIQASTCPREGDSQLGLLLERRQKIHGRALLPPQTVSIRERLIQKQVSPWGEWRHCSTGNPSSLPRG